MMLLFHNCSLERYFCFQILQLMCTFKGICSISVSPALSSYQQNYNALFQHQTLSFQMKEHIIISDMAENCWKLLWQLHLKGPPGKRFIFLSTTTCITFRFPVKAFQITS